MNKRKIIALIFLVIATILGAIFYLNIDYPDDFGKYFKKSYYSQLGAVTICIELFVAGYYVFRGNKKANFALALFGFTTFLDIIFDVSGLVNSNVPVYGMVIFATCAVAGFYIAFSNAFNLGKITVWRVLFSFLLGNAIEWFFNFY